MKILIEKGNTKIMELTTAEYNCIGTIIEADEREKGWECTDVLKQKQTILLEFGR